MQIRYSPVRIRLPPPPNRWKCEASGRTRRVTPVSWPCRLFVFWAGVKSRTTGPIPSSGIHSEFRRNAFFSATVASRDHRNPERHPHFRHEPVRPIRLERGGLRETPAGLDGFLPAFLLVAASARRCSGRTSWRLVRPGLPWQPVHTLEESARWRYSCGRRSLGQEGLSGGCDAGRWLFVSDPSSAAARGRDE